MIAVLLRRYKVLCLIGVTIVIIQIFLGYKSTKLATDSYNSDESTNEQNDRFTFLESSSVVKSIYQDQKDTENNERFSILLNEWGVKPKCEISKDKEVVSAVHRAKSRQCKEHIIDVACKIKSGSLFPKTLPNTCPSGNYIIERSLGCYQDDKKHRLLPEFYANFKDTNSPKKCIQMCLQSGYLYAGVQYSTECFCGNKEPNINTKLPDSSCNMKCPAEPKFICGGYFTINIYGTGISDVTKPLPKINKEENVRIVFLLTLNGRAIRQIYRLLKSLYSVNHFYYIHVDSRQDYIFRELLKLEPKFSNIRLSRRRYSTIWGGASLLKMLLSCMTDILELDWHWDYVLNLSESDFPIKTLDKLEAFLSANRNKNFVKSHGREVQRFIQKQGLDKTFVECDIHMWRIGERNLPDGIQIDGGSDWVCLSRSFVSYVTLDQKDELIKGLLEIFQYTLLPAESFFHTAIRNSVFCDTYIDNNLHITNWKRKMGCKCQYKSIVDWCGCSPNDFKPDDWPRLQATELKQLFFGRKFEPSINQLIILQLEEWLFGSYPHGFENLNSYWQNTYHHKDKSPAPKDSLLTVAESLIRINSKSNNFFHFYEPLKILEITDYWELEVYKGFLIKHEARFNNFTVILETWCRPSHHHAQISKSNPLAKRIMQLDVSTDFDQKELVSRNFAKIIGENSEPVLITKFSGYFQSKITKVNLTIVWIDSSEKIRDVTSLVIEDITITAIYFSKSNLFNELQSGVWTVKILYNKTLIAVTKFLVVPNLNSSSKENNLSHNIIDKDVVNFFSIENTCVFFNKRNIRDIVIGYLAASNGDWNGKPFQKLLECKKTKWSTFSPDPKSKLSNDAVNVDGSS
ncbi:CLUMA_CG020302, isoform A [Clunio marinus]|uniref:protein xylosyltransferase n=1 Tax=Clunio marinus TaxID=568069 RepID=A0A1J1J4J8_9DIPT|nr:CLUMA_CG020302, isoform A [Clunio marinus]